MKILRVEDPDNEAMEECLAAYEAQQEQAILNALGKALTPDVEADRVRFLEQLHHEDE